jgi:acyl-CoA synthetase (AMP-forming)/AMP-acid ligase II
MLIPFTLHKALRLFPQKVAVVDGNRRYTYQEFGERVNRLAHYLQTSGIRENDCISLLHFNSHYCLEAYFATAQIGAILNPLNIRLSPRELSFIIGDSGSRLLIVHRDYCDQFSQVINLAPERRLALLWTGEGPLPLSLEGKDYEEALAESPGTPIHFAPLSDGAVAHLYYTSGTTGRPKGVMLTHKNVCTHALAAIAELHLTDEDIWAHIAPLFHLADAWATFAITWVGGRHVLVNHFDALNVLQTIEQEKITLTNLIPTMLNMLVNHPHVPLYDYSSLRVLLSGGSSIAPDLVRRIMEAFGCDYIQTYGMTETSPYLTMSILKQHIKALPPQEQFTFRCRTGREFLGVELKVVNEQGEEIMPDGRQVGEIIVRGDIVTPGYWKQPEETARAFKEGWLYTGDLATMDREGYVNIVDRKKDMIVTGGENVFSTEVENALYEHPAVLEAAVFGISDPTWGEAVTAAIVTKPGFNVEADELRHFCKKRIAHYKVPKSIFFLEELPKTGSGKIFKKGLRDRYRSEQ